MSIRVLFTQGLSNVYDAIALIRKAMTPGELYLAASYRTECTPLRAVADALILEPETADAEAYIEWLLGCCRRHKIHLLWPQSRLPVIFEYRQRLNDEGIEVLLPCADRDRLATLDDKTKAAESLNPFAISLPRWQPFQTAAELDAALAVLGYPANRVCIKPAVSIYAQGFRALDDRRDPFSRFLYNDTHTISLAELKTLLDMNPEGRAFLAMEYLAGEERSIDCLVADGVLLQSVTRRKPAAGGRVEIIEDDVEGQTIAARLCQAFALNGLINVQTRERLRPDGVREQCFLEVNPRMSGGINMACESGLVLPYWALRLAAGTARPQDVPAPRTGLVVTTIYQALTLGELSAMSLPGSEPDRASSEISGSQPLLAESFPVTVAG